MEIPNETPELFLLTKWPQANDLVTIISKNFRRIGIWLWGFLEAISTAGVSDWASFDFSQCQKIINCLNVKGQIPHKSAASNATGGFENDFQKRNKLTMNVTSFIKINICCLGSVSAIFKYICRAYDS